MVARGCGGGGDGGGGDDPDGAFRVAQEEHMKQLAKAGGTRLRDAKAGLHQKEKEKRGRVRDAAYRRERHRAPSRADVLPEVSQRDMSRSYQSPSLGYEEFKQVPETPQLETVREEQEMTKAEFDRARRQLAEGYSGSRSMPGAIGDVSMSMSMSNAAQARLSASAGDSFAGVIGGTSAAMLRGMRSRTRSEPPADVPVAMHVPGQGRVSGTKPNVFGSSVSRGRALDAFMHTSDANLPRSQQRSRTDLSFLNQAARAVAGATGLRPGTPTGADNPGRLIPKGTGP